MDVNQKPLAIVIDTNAVHCESPDDIIAKGFLNTWAHLKRDYPNFILLVPEVVILERSAQRCAMAIQSRNRARGNIETVNKIANRNRSFELSDKEIRSSVEKATWKAFKKVAEAIIEVPYSKIDWPDVFHDSVWKIPPFSDDGTEKGFRDRIILECIKHIFPDYSDSHEFCVVTNDKLLSEAIEVEWFGLLQCFDKTSEINAYETLRRNEHTKTIAAKLLSKAKKKFFTKNDSSTLWYKEDLASITLPKHREEFNPNNMQENNLSSFTEWRPSNNRLGFLQIGNTSFVECTEDGRFHWDTIIHFKKEWHQNTDNFTAPIQRINVEAEFRYRWSTKITSDARFMNLALTDVSVENKRITEIPAENEIEG